MDEFIKKLGGTRKLEISNLKRVLPGTCRDVLIANRFRDLYIIGGKQSGLTRRCGNKDIQSKTYFIIDIDIRDNYYKLHNKVLSEAMLLGEIKILVYLLNGDRFLSEYSFIINSGNGVHVYYCGKELIVGKDITPEEYSRGVKKIYDIYVEYLGKKMHIVDRNYKHFYPDYMCSNIARGTRLPLSYNMKKKYGLPPLKVQFYEQKTQNYSRLVEKIPILGKEVIVKKTKYKRQKGRSNGKYKKIDVNDFSIIEVIKKYTGKDYSTGIGSCPLPGHTDKKPSFSVRVKENYFNCFSKCGGGDPANFIAKIEGIPYGEAIRKLDENF